MQVEHLQHTDLKTIIARHWKTLTGSFDTLAAPVQRQASPLITVPKLLSRTA